MLDFLSQAWKRGLAVCSPGETVDLWPHAASLGILPPKVSRHATPARSHVISKFVRSALRNSAEEYIVVIYFNEIIYKRRSIQQYNKIFL